MFRLTRPNEAEITAFRRAQGSHDLSYATPGMTDAPPRSGFTADHARIELGRGPAAWDRARAAIRAWRMFDVAWVELFDAQAPIEPGTTVAVLVRVMGLWSLNATRVVGVIDERDRFGFAYGTLPDHAESGEERFLVERGPDGTVHYDLVALSRPHQVLPRLFRPWTRVLQRRFRRDSLAAMVRAVSS
jgi:uncharacterized protein (UPF0548 family)